MNSFYNMMFMSIRYNGVWKEIRNNRVCKRRAWTVGGVYKSLSLVYRVLWIHMQCLRVSLLLSDESSLSRNMSNDRPCSIMLDWQDIVQFVKI